MDVSAFDFDLPTDRIAQHPAQPRESAKLLSIQATGLSDYRIACLPGLLRPGDLVVVNDTKVIPARLFGKRGEAGIEITLHKALGDGDWLAFARPAKKLRPDDRIVFDGDFAATVTEKREAGEVRLVFDLKGDAFYTALDRAGVMPLPPYIKREKADRAADSEDRQDYQTHFAREPGAVAAPTASLHFTDDLCRSIEAAGAEFAALTLHVGAGTFLPVKVENTDDHVMHAETGILSSDVADRLNETKQSGGRIIAVGTTVLRLLESAVDEAGVVHPFNGETDIFITPGHTFRTADLLLTNFHLPKSTLFMLICAFGGTEIMKAAYRHAIDSQYRFYSYGDACLIRRTG
ncbi:MAG: tRNA preQ1(34) S-adenosylmethionine ribosyltransferase-isomerase QueA [Alphaproteobacteria bacterium]